MNAHEILLELRTKHNLTQEQMAERLFVTRQAVSRWENGETLPTIDSFKRIAQEFGVSVDELLGNQRNQFCQSCTYPLHKPEELGTNADGSLNADYCVYCYKDGEWVDPTMTVQGVIDYTVPYMVSPSMTADEARTKLEEFVPNLKRWKK